MKFKLANWTAALAFGLIPGAVLAQSNDALLNALVKKGILTTEEAEQLKKESAEGFNKASQGRTGLPDWVTSLRFYGDVRGRFEGFYFENDTPGAPNDDRNRLRYRLRFGTIATFKDNLELGFRLMSGEPVGGFGGDPISGNTTFQDNASGKFIYVDLAYGKWTPVNTDTWKLGGTIGKMENPFSISPMLFDDDYTPEGISLQSAYHFSKEQSLKLNSGFFVLDEINQGGDAGDDPFLLGAQLKWDAQWTKQIDSSVGLGFFSITDAQTLTNGAIPNVNAGNTRRTDATRAGALRHDFNSVVADAAVTYWLESIPLYPGRFPIRAFGTFAHNTSAPNENDAVEAGVAFGKSGKKGTWEFSYRWRYTEQDSWFEEFMDSDFGAFYETAPLGASSLSGLSAGYRGGTGVKGHVLRTSYSPYDALTLGVSYFLSELLDPSVVGGEETESRTGRLQVDAVWRF